MPLKTKMLPVPEILHDERHPMERFLRTDRLPHIWCSGCGLGTALSCCMFAMDELEIDPDDICVVSGIGCTGRVAGYLNLDSYHTTHGRPIPFAIGLKLAQPKKKVIVFSGDGDLFAIGGNHFIHAARRNIDITVICVNNFNYGMTGGQISPTTPLSRLGTTAPYGSYENPFNLPYVAASCGAVYVARWTTLHARRLTTAMMEAITKPGFTFVEVLSPCPTNYGRRNRIGEGIDEMRVYAEKSIIRHGADPKDADLIPVKEILVGKFIDEERPTFFDMYEQQIGRKITDRS